MTFSCWSNTIKSKGTSLMAYLGSLKPVSACPNQTHAINTRRAVLHCIYLRRRRKVFPGGQRQQTLRCFHPETGWIRLFGLRRRSHGQSHRLDRLHFGRANVIHHHCPAIPLVHFGGFHPTGPQQPMHGGTFVIKFLSRGHLDPLLFGTFLEGQIACDDMRSIYL